MDAEFWHRKWHDNEIGFHMSEANPMLLAYFHRLGLQAGQRVFLPLCGKTRDIAWLLEQGFAVVGAELSSVAVDQLFNELNIIPRVTEYEALLHYQGSGPRGTKLDLFVGDVFLLSANLLGAVDALYDRAALVALPPEMRAQYAEHMLEISNRAPQLLITFDYDESQLTGPPFCVNEAEVRQLYRGMSLQRLASEPVSGGLKGVCPAQEQVFLLRSATTSA